MIPSFFSIPYYHDYLSPTLAHHLLEQAQPVAGVPGLSQVGWGGGLETPEALRFLATLFERVEDQLAAVLARRILDRKFIDERVKAIHRFNRDLGRDFLDWDYRTILGLTDASGRIVIGPKDGNFCRKVAGKPIAPLPGFLTGPHVTLFGPPDSAKMAINAMNAFHRKLPAEPAIVEALLKRQDVSPIWGADDEDSKTPLRSDLIDAAVNLTACFEGTLAFEESGKSYALAPDHLALPIKRIPGLALPSSFLFHRRNPIPLHLYDFALHLFRNWRDARALVFYIPKLENEEEAQYVHHLIKTAESLILATHPSYVPGSVRVMVVLENPRAILRAHEIMDSLYPYFAGASLGWHDYLASTARLFKEDSNYRIPCKADPDIVIKYIQASHRLVADVVGSRGGIRVGGMYGILPWGGHPESLQVTLRGFIKDVITQMKRDLTGFWVAHPDFVRLGLALVQAWKERLGGDPKPLRDLVTALLEEKHRSNTLEFIDGSDINGLDLEDPGYVRSLIVADMKESEFIANNHPDEIRYNVFQSLQYLADWLSGRGCVALPTIIDGIPVRVMDDLATAERSRWEVWHELRHGRFSIEAFIQIAHEELNFIRRDLSNDRKIVQVKWDERTSRWYPIAFRLMMQLMTAENPVEFATELLIPFTVDLIRNAADPWHAAQDINPDKFKLPAGVARFDHYFEICGSARFASAMAANPVEDPTRAEEIISGFSPEEIRTAAGFHGDIGQTAGTLDPQAAREQSRASSGHQSLLKELRELGDTYRTQFGFKFLISAQGRSAQELLLEMKRRIGLSLDEEMANARLALLEITRKRMVGSTPSLQDRIEALRKKHDIVGLSIAINRCGKTQALAFGESETGKRKTAPSTWFQLASLSKTVGTAYAIEYFRSRTIPLDSSVNSLLSRTTSPFRLRCPSNPDWADRVTLSDLMSHSALGMHYVRGVPATRSMPSVSDLVGGNPELGFDPIEVIGEPGRSFHYSGGGFLVLEHLIESLEMKPVRELTRPFLKALGLQELSFDHAWIEQQERAHGYFDSGLAVEAGGMQFPAFAAGSWGSSRCMARFLVSLTEAYHSLQGSPGLSHDTAVEMLHGSDRGSRKFMGCEMGLGVFTAEAGPNRLAIHQGANEGFRAIFIQCYEGPDSGKGLVVQCNGDNRGVLLIAEVVRELLAVLQIQGITLEKLPFEFGFQGLPQEQIVNLGYKSLLFDAFEPRLPEKIESRGPLDPLASYNLTVGARIREVSNQKFARAENLISAHLPNFDPGLFGRQGKIMDSWETVRHNPKDQDSLILELTRPAAIRYVSLSTKFHDGNQPEYVRLCARGSKDSEWAEILPKTPLSGHSLLQIDLGKLQVAVHSEVQVEIFPDGGLSRLGLFSELPSQLASPFQVRSEAKSVRFNDPIPKTSKPLTIAYQPNADEIRRNLDRTSQARARDWASLALGGSVVRASNEHYGPAAQVISPFPPLHMFDGMESARSRKSGHSEEVVIRLGKSTAIERVILDFTYFVNNNPLEISIDGLTAGGAWTELVERKRVKAFASNRKVFEIHSDATFEQLRVRTYPDGGINRIQVFGPR